MQKHVDRCVDVRYWHRTNVCSTNIMVEKSVAQVV